MRYNDMEKSKRYSFLWLAVTVALFAVCVAFAQKSNDMAASRGMKTFGTVVRELEMNYVDTIDNDRAFEQAINALLATVDPYTVYYPQEDREDITKMTTGEYGGIGSYLLERNGSTYISEPMENSPAAVAGLRAGDRIVRVDTIDVAGMNTSQISKLLRGHPDTDVRIQVIRPFDPDSVKSFTLKRKKLREPSVPFYGVLNGNTGYIRVNQFIEKTGDEVREALESFRANPAVDALIIDLRGNGGGLVEQAVDMASNFLPKGTEVVRTKRRNADMQKIYKTQRTPIYPDIPLAVLIDGATASSAEIFAGAIQDLDRGVLIGTRSYGKGLVQTTLPLPYNGVLKVTVARYYTPSGRLIQALDYGRRNEDGSAMRVPDSLTNAYSTAHGRIIRDGGGLQPDSIADWPEITRIVYNIVSDNWAFDYANKFAYLNPAIPPAGEFVITDSIYSDFKASIDPARFKYNKPMEEATEELRKIAQQEGYLNPETTAAFDTLKKLFTHNLDHDLDIHRPQIESYLGAEIVSRYYLNRGRSEYAVRNDSTIDKAVEILHSPVYRQLLTP